MKRYVATFYRHWWLYLPILILLLAGTAVGNQAYLNAHAGMHFGSAVAYSGNSSMANAPNYRAGGAGSANASF